MATNLELINNTSFSSTANIDVTNVFSADYDVYKIIVVTTSGTNNYIPSLRLIDSGGSVISSGYDEAHLEMKYTGFTEFTKTNVSRFRIAGNTGSSAGQGSASTIYIFNPYSSTSYTFLTEQSMVDITGIQAGQKGIGVLKQSASMSGFRIYEQIYGANLSGKISVYGVK